MSEDVKVEAVPAQSGQCLPELEGYDWGEAFKYATPNTTRLNSAVLDDAISTAPFTREDVAEIRRIQVGENDGADWMVAGRLHDGRWFFLSAWCDYTGWGCQEGGSSCVASTWELLVRYGMAQDTRDYWGLNIDGTSQ